MSDATSGGASRVATVEEEKAKRSKRKAASSDSGVAAAPPKKIQLQRYCDADTTTTDLEEPRSIDIVCGRGCSRFTKAAGNVAFRRLIERSFPRYEAGNMCAREKINREIVELVKAQPGAPRFLKMNPTTRVWEELSFRKSAERTSQAFRDFRSRTSCKAGDKGWLIRR
jgi:hypothetical protein